MKEQMPTEVAACPDGEFWCRQVYNLTGNQWLSDSASWLIGTPLQILLILLVAFLVRHVVRKLIHRATTPRSNSDDKMPALLRPLRDRSSDMLGPVVMERRRQRAKTIGSVLQSVTTFVVYGLAFVLVLGEVGINLGPIIASAGIVGVALGFGAQNLVKDFLSGIFMMLEDQYGVGDVVDVGEAAGTVEAVGLRITTLRDLNGTVWYVRNGEVLRVGNSSQGFAVAVVDVPLAYNADVGKANRIINDVAIEAAASDAMKADVLEPPEMLGVDKVTAEGIQMRLTMKVRPGRQWSVQRAMRAKILPALEEAGIEPPLGRYLPGSASAG